MTALENPFNDVKASFSEAACVAHASSRQVARSQTLVTLDVGSVSHKPQDLCMNFQISLNEEHTFLNVSYGNNHEIDLGERTHHYCLLTLARRRLNDAKIGLDSSSQGWVELAQLSKSLGIEPEHLNIQIFRARTQLINALPQLAQLPSIIERRRGELRFGAHQFSIVRGSKIEGKYSPIEDLAFV